MTKADNDTLSAPPEKLLEWLRGIEVVGCTRIEARHIVAGSEAGSAVSTWEIKEAEDGGERFDGPALYRRLEEDAEGFGGIQRYTLLAYRENAKAPRDRITLRVDGGTDANASGSEPANATGLVAQAHRHNEAMMRMVMQSVASSMEILAKQNAIMAAALEKANEEKVEMWTILGDVAKSDKERDELKHKLALDEKRADIIQDSIKLAIPGLIAKVLPSKELANIGLERFVESLNDEQRASVFSVLTPEQAVALGAVLDEFIKKKEESKNSSTTESAAQ